jgi:hypothetical protein
MSVILFAANATKESTSSSVQGDDIEKEVRFDPVDYGRFVVFVAFGQSAFKAVPPPAASYYSGGIIVKLVAEGVVKLANQSYTTHISNIGFHASISEGFEIPKQTSLIFSVVLEHQPWPPAIRNNFATSSLRVKHSTLRVD